MDDLKITKLCAQAVGVEVRQIESDLWTDVDECVIYNPLHDDAQAMVLVKTFRIEIMRGSEKRYLCMINDSGVDGGYDDDLNRAICECVAKMQEKLGRIDARH